MNKVHIKIEYLIETMLYLKKILRALIYDDKKFYRFILIQKAIKDYYLNNMGKIK